MPNFDESMLDSLVMDQARIKILKALAKSYIRVTQRGDHIEHDPWAADFVRGKGSGLIFLLHGKSGVGKTVTAGQSCPFAQAPRSCALKVPTVQSFTDTLRFTLQKLLPSTAKGR